MKITKTQLKQIIKEEIEAELNEGAFSDVMTLLGGIFFPDESDLEQRRKLDSMTDEELAKMVAKTRHVEKQSPESGRISARAGEIKHEEEAAAAAAAEEAARAHAEYRETSPTWIARRKRKEQSKLNKARGRARAKQRAGSPLSQEDKDLLGLEEAILRKVLEKLK